MGYLICGIYEKRPEMCKKYPERDSYIPEQCSFYFTDDSTRKGSCDPECQASCCVLPRHNGDPVAPGMPGIAGGEPCKHLVYVDRHPSLSELPGGGGAEPEGDREEDRGESNPVELALVEIDRSKRNQPGAKKVGA